MSGSHFGLDLCLGAATATPAPAVDFSAVAWIGDGAMAPGPFLSPDVTAAAWDLGLVLILARCSILRWFSGRLLGCSMARRSLLRCLWIPGSGIVDRSGLEDLVGLATPCRGGVLSPPSGQSGSEGLLNIPSLSPLSSDAWPDVPGSSPSTDPSSCALRFCSSCRLFRSSATFAA